MKLPVLCMMALCLCASEVHAKAKVKAKAKEAAAAATPPATSSPAAATAPTQAAPVPEAPATPGAAEKALALPVAKFEEAGLYTISTTVGGEEVALTFIVPTGDIRPGTLTTNAEKARVVAQKLAGGPEQQWQPTDAKVNPPMFLLRPKVSDDESRLTGILKLYRPDMRFIDADEYHDKYNRPTVSYHNGDVSEYWYIVKLDNGKYKITSAKGHPSNMNKPGETWGEKWNESRWLEAVKQGADVKLRFRRPSDAPGQEWTFTKVGTYFKG